MLISTTPILWDKVICGFAQSRCCCSYIVRVCGETGAPRAFSDLFGKFLVPMKLGKSCVILGKKYTILGKKSVILSKFGKVYLSKLDFSANWECFRSIGNFFSQLGKNLVPETRPSLV